MAQLGLSPARPLLTVPTAANREEPSGTDAAGTSGHGRRERSWLWRGRDGHQLDRRVRPVPGDHLPRWQAAKAARQAPLGYEAPAGCLVGYSLVVLVLLDLGERLSVVSVCTGSSRLLAAGLGDKCSDKPRLWRHLAAG